MLRADNLHRRREGDCYRLGGELFTADEVVRLFRAGLFLHTSAAVLVRLDGGGLRIMRGVWSVLGANVDALLAIGSEAPPGLVLEAKLRIRHAPLRGSA